jgi:hypothetical protein
LTDDDELLFYCAEGWEQEFGDDSLSGLRRPRDSFPAKHDPSMDRRTRQYVAGVQNSR